MYPDGTKFVQCVNCRQLVRRDRAAVCYVGDDVGDELHSCDECDLKRAGEPEPGGWL